MKERDLLVWTQEMVSNFWDYESQFSDNYFSYEHGRPIVEEIKPYLKGASRVLDYGCGPGYLVENFLESGFKTAGMDSSVESRQRVAERFSGEANFLGAFSDEELAASDLRFDAVTVIEVIEHLYDPWLDDLLERLKLVLGPGGVLIFTTPNEEDLSKNYILSPDSNKLFHRWQHVRSWSANSLTTYLEEKGFEVIKCYATNFKASFHTNKTKRDGQWSTLKKIKYRMKGRKREHNLIAIARLASA